MTFQQAPYPSVPRVKILLRYFSTFIKNRFGLFGSSEIVYSRLYGYTKDNNGQIVAIKSESKIIRMIFEETACGNAPSDIKDLLDSQNSRNRSGKPFSTSDIKNMIRPIFAGLVKTRYGFYVRSKVYPPIVDRKTWERAAKMVKTA